MRNRHGVRLRGDAFENGVRRLADRLPMLWDGTVLDGELTTGRFKTTMAALFGSKTHRADLRFVVFDVPILAGVDLRLLPWQERRDRLDLVAEAFDVPLELSPVIDPTRGLAIDTADGRLEGIVLKDRTSPYRDGSPAGRWKLKDPRWYEREAWRFDHR
jgi:ATP-dependent DNA ligase